ncbi:hypothetical protein chiPu_0032176, partial [Chiloscyllium punctatum]|nr:hypothetical protein [Chiloscyllium punctatum]
ADGSLDVRQAQVKAKIVERRHRPGAVRLDRRIRSAGGAVVALRSHAFREVIAVGGHGAALSRRHRLARVERKATDVADRANRLALVGRADRARRILDHRDTARLCNRLDLIHRSGETEQVDRNDRLRARRDRGLQPFRSDIEGRQIDVDEDGFCADIFRGVRACHPGEGRDNHLVARPKVQGQGRQMQRRGARRAREGML